MQLKDRAQQGASLSAPLLRIKSGQFVTKKVEENYKVKRFRHQHDLDAKKDNLFVEFGWVELEQKDNMHNIKDVILMDKVEKL